MALLADTRCWPAAGVGLVLALHCVACGRSQRNGDVASGAAGQGGITDEGICDGSMDLRLAVRTESGGSLPIALHRELGDTYLYVRGDCRYWILDFQQNPGWVPTRTGELTREQEQRLFEELHYDRFGELAGVYRTASSGGEWETYYDGTHSIWCQDGCYENHPTAPDELKGMGVNVLHQRAWWVDLLATSEAMKMSDPVRVVIGKREGEEPGEETPCRPAWPFSLDPEPYACPFVDNEPFGGAGAGGSSLIDDPVEAAELRSWWLDRRDSSTCDPLGSGFLVGFLSAKDPTVRYVFAVRDAVPLENDQGLIPIPFP